MKLKFDAHLDYQHQAISSVVDLFRGQPIKQSLFSVSPDGRPHDLLETEGVGNRLELIDEEILKNLQEVQLRNGLAQSTELNGLDFDVEMETGTGKTYVYLRTIFELNKTYGFTKFIIVVPNVAIKEGVYKSLQITKDHLSSLYDNICYDFFIYDSSKLNQVFSFAVSDHISIMVINIDAFRKSFENPEEINKANIIHRPNDKLNGLSPIQLIQETNPFVIIDEPQSVDNTQKAQEAISKLNALCRLRYSATHVINHHMIYRLNAIDSFQLELVKQIEVASLRTEGQHNDCYMKLEKVNSKNSKITARIELDAYDKKGKIQRKTFSVKMGDDLKLRVTGIFIETISYPRLPQSPGVRRFASVRNLKRCD